MDVPIFPNNVTEGKNLSCKMSESETKFYEVFSWWLAGVCTVTVASFGLILNFIAIYILCKQRMRESFFNRLLICLTIVDSLFLANGIYVATTMQFLDNLSSYDSHLILFTNFVYPARNVFMCSAIYMTVGLAYERYTSIVKPFLQRDRQSADKCNRLLWYVIPVITFSIIFYIPKFFDLQLAENILCRNLKQTKETTKPNCSTKFTVIPTDIRINEDYILWYINIANLIVTVIIPGVLLTFFNYNIHVACKERRKKKTTVVRAFMIHQGSNSYRICKGNT